MPQIIPFQGYFYNQQKVNIHDVVAPPYDVISPQQQAALYDRSPHNVVRLILGREEDRYAAAARYLQEWIRDGILVRDREPAIYVLHQTFEAENRQVITRKGFIALCKLEEFEKRIVLPHEKTLAKPREDRFKLFKATNCNFSQIFSLYSDPEQRIDRAFNGFINDTPAVDVLFEDVRNTLWRIPDERAIRTVQALMKDKQVLIADGHHRYETALAYRDLNRADNPHHTGNELYNYVMMFFTNIDDEGLVIYPTHRLVHSLPSFDPQSFFKSAEEFFVIREYKTKDDLIWALRSSPVSAFGAATGERPHYHLLTLKPSQDIRTVIGDSMPDELLMLDATLLHVLLIGRALNISVDAQEQKRNLDYVRHHDEAIEAVHSGRAQIAFIMNPTKIAQVRAVARAGYTMPQKSTFFFPKLVSGIVLHRMEH